MAGRANMSYAEAVEWLYGLQRFGIKLGLEKITALLERLGNPQRSFSSLHVAGTNGKGTCSAAAHAVLTAHGVSSGLYTSPHLIDLRERALAGRSPLSEEFVARWVEREREYIVREKVTFFETVTALAFEYFSVRGMHAVVVEAGLGGRWDATNALVPELSVITSIGREHEAWLGRGLARIAAEKAGIVKPGVPLLTAETGKTALGVFSRYCREKGAELLPLSDQVRLSRIRTMDSGCRFEYRSADQELEADLPLFGAHQARNAALGIRAAEIVLGRLGVAVDPALTAGALRRAALPGRFQRVRLDSGREIVLDVAHNPPAASRLAEVWRRVFCSRRATVITALAADKDSRRFLAALCKVAARFILPEIDFGRADNRSGAAGPANLAREIRELPGAPEAVRVADMREALQLAGRFPLEQPALVTGSFRTVGEAMRELGLSALPNGEEP